VVRDDDSGERSKSEGERDEERLGFLSLSDVGSEYAQKGSTHAYVHAYVYAYSHQIDRKELEQASVIWKV